MIYLSIDEENISQKQYSWNIMVSDIRNIFSTDFIKLRFFLAQFESLLFEFLKKLYDIRQLYFMLVYFLEELQGRKLLRNDKKE